MHIAKKLYGTSCEICGWAEATTDVHHMDYFDREEGDPKSESTDDYAVLCPNHHRWVHDKKINREKLLTMIKARIKISHEVRRLLNG